MFLTNGHRTRNGNPIHDFDNGTSWIHGQSRYSHCAIKGCSVTAVQPAFPEGGDDA